MTRVAGDAEADLRAGRSAQGITVALTVVTG